MAAERGYVDNKGQENKYTGLNSRRFMSKSENLFADFNQLPKKAYDHMVYGHGNDFTPFVSTTEDVLSLVRVDMPDELQKIPELPISRSEASAMGVPVDRSGLGLSMLVPEIIDFGSSAQMGPLGGDLFSILEESGPPLSSDLIV